MSVHEIERRPVGHPSQPAKSDLITNYHGIGIQAASAALACRPKKQPEQYPLYEPREES